MFSLVFKLVKFLFNAAVVYAASPEGAAELTAVMDEAEADGIDIPFYEPSEGQQGESGGQGDEGTTAEVAQPKPRGKSWAERHPDLVGESKSQ